MYSLKGTYFKSHKETSIQHNDEVEKKHRVETKEHRERCVGEFQRVAAKARAPAGLSGHGVQSGPKGQQRQSEGGWPVSGHRPPWGKLSLGQPGEQSRLAYSRRSFPPLQETSWGQP